MKYLRVVTSMAAVMSCLPAFAADRVAPAISLKALPFEPGEVRLLDGPFKHAMDLDAAYLLTLKPDRLLSGYRATAGLKPKADAYGGWESQGIAGHSLGHYLSACSRMRRAAGDERFRERVDYIVAELAKCQEANGDGFLGAMPNGKQVFAEIARGEIRSAGFDLNGSWVPWYNLHKLFAGLLDAYRYADNAAALDAARPLADWAVATTKNLSPDQWQQMLACEHGGMNEALAELYALTGNDAYLELAKKFYHAAVLDALAAGRDELDGKHANTQIPKAIGAARIYELTAEEKFGRISQFFWQTVIDHHTYVTGGNSDGEHFGPPGKLDARLGVNTTETCNTYNMLKLTALLFRREPRGDYADYMERALWNHILASQHPDTGAVCYYVSLQPGYKKDFRGPLDFTCCNGTGMENHARYGDYIYFHNADALWVNQFIASEVEWAAKKVRVRQETDFPRQAVTRFRISCEAPTTFSLRIRRPRWVVGKLDLKVDGAAIDEPADAQGYIQIDRQWRDGAVVELALPLQLRTEAMPDNAHRLAIFDGPILLAGDLGDVNAEPRVPVLVTDNRPVDQWLTPVADDPLAYRTAGVARPQDFELRPFYRVYDRRYSVYWEVVDEAGWTARDAAYEADRRREQELAARTVDQVRLGEMQPERDHIVQGEKTAPGEFNGRKFRHAWDGGWFSCDVAVPVDQQAELVVTYWGSETGDREFDILVDGEKLAAERLHQDSPNRFWEKTYPLPSSRTAGKNRVTLRFQGHPGNYAGGVFGIRILKGD